MTLDNQYNQKPNYTIIILVFLLLLFFLVKSELAKSSTYNNEQKILEDENYNLASQLHSAFNISFISQWITTFDEKAIFDIASKVKDFKALQEAYYALYSETLISRLEKTFVDDPKKVNLFYAQIKANSGGTSSNGSVLPVAGTLKLNGTVTALKTLDALDYTNSTQVLKRFNAAEDVGKYLGDYPTLIKGVRYAVVEISVNWYTSNKKALIIKNSLISY